MTDPNSEHTHWSWMIKDGDVINYATRTCHCEVGSFHANSLQGAKINDEQLQALIARAIREARWRA